MKDFGYIERNLHSLREAMLSAARRAGTSEPLLVAVTKSATDEELCALVGLGVTDIGENRPQELVRRAELLGEHGLHPAMHQIGTLQSNKAKLVAPVASLIHSLSSASLVSELVRRSRIISRPIPVLIEINCAREEQKDGVLPEDAEAFLCSVKEHPELEVRGLMTMGPADCGSEELRPYFRKTRELFERLGAAYGFGSDPVLSMGMSQSFEVAIEEGSTLVRVGRMLFEK